MQGLTSFSIAMRKPLHRATLPGCISASSVAATDESSNMEQPDKIFPEKQWGWNKAPPKLSLTKHHLPEPQDQHALPWILNLIELIHW